jgi:UPF0042 nucleotide-binding protein
VKDTLRVVIVTGISGAGRRTAAHVLEDIGWYVVDNVPPPLVAAVVNECIAQGVTRLALGIDARSAGSFDRLPAMFQALSEQGIKPEVCFLEASDQAIVRRQESNRRPLPLQGEGTLLEGIARERALLATLRISADVTFDTSELTANQLALRVNQLFGSDTSAHTAVLLMSFGFKNGVPLDADMVFDARFLPNPYWVPELRPLTGLAPAVRDYVMVLPPAKAFLEQLEGLLAITRPGYLHEGKRVAVVAIGCTGGQHRSVVLVEQLAARLRQGAVTVSVLHRDVSRG